MGYVELHAHSAYSFLDGASLPEELAIRGAELGYGALALTDHDGVYGSLEFAQAAKAFGVRPITGAEVTLAGGSHVTLLVESSAGYANLCRLLSAPEITHAFFSEHRSGLFVADADSGRIALPEIDFTVLCSKGFYVRTYAHDIGETLGCLAHLKNLRRTKSGRFSVEGAITVEELKTEEPVDILPRILTLPEVSRMRGA